MKTEWYWYGGGVALA